MLDVEVDSPVPIYEQIIAQLTYAIAAGDLKTGEMIPSVREVSKKLVVNPNTVAKAFQELERQGIVISRRGRGMEVTEQAPEQCEKLTRELVRERLRTALREAVSSRLSSEEIEQILSEELHKLNGEHK